MRHFRLLAVLLFLFSISLKAQLEVVSTSPLNGKYNVAVGQSISVTFNEPLDTTMDFNEQNFIINDIHLNGTGTYFFSADGKTITFAAQTVADKDYSFCFYGLRSVSGDTLSAPYVYRFTTETEFSGVTVSGTVTSCDSNFSVAHTLIALLTGPVEADSSRPILTTVANADGGYSLPYVKDGVYWFIAVKDIDNNGTIDDNDRIAFVDSLVVQGENLDNININFPCLLNYSFSVVRAKMDSAARVNIPDFEDYTLIVVNGRNVKPDGSVSDWEFLYKKNNSLYDWYQGSISFMPIEEIDFNSGDFSDWFPADEMVALDTNVFHAASPDSLLKFAEANGGAAFRNQIIPEGYELDVEYNLGWLNARGYSAPDNGLYWGLRYSISDNQGGIYKEKEYIADLRTGQIITMNGVSENNEIPTKFKLEQNYPNPFSKGASGESITNINFSVPSTVDIRLNVYNILGQKVATLINERLSPGNYHVTFNGAELPSGIYFYKLQTSNFSITKKMLLLK